MAKTSALAEVKKLRARAARWVRGSRTRRGGAAALTAVLVLAMASAFLHEYWRAAFSSQPPIAEQARRAAREKASQLAAAVENRLFAKGRLQGDAWSAAQILVALKENNAEYRSQASAKAIERYFRSMAGPERSEESRVGKEE